MLSSAKQWHVAPAIWLVTCLAATSAVLTAGRTLNVTSDVQLVAALADPSIDTIQIVRDTYLKETSGDWTPFKPQLITANVTVQSVCGSTCTTEEFRILDFGYLIGLVLLDVNVALTFKHVVLASVRKPAGVGLDLVLGRQGSSVILDSILGHRYACSPSTFQSQVLQNTPVAPGAPGSRAVSVLESFCWRGKCYANTLHYVNYATQIAPSILDGSLSSYGADAGFTYTLINSTRLCDSYWPLDCLNRLTADACNIQYTDAALVALQPPQSGVNAAAIAVPVALGVTLLLGGLVALLLARRRRPQRQRQQAPLPGGKDVETGDGYIGSKGIIGPLYFGNGPPLAYHDANWQVLACHTNPEHESKALVEDNIQLGVLLGAGSSGRVYRGRWRDKDVAVKVLQHDAGTAKVVSNEIDLTMSFRHPNIVSAYHVIAWRHSRASAGTQGTLGTPGTHGTPVKAMAKSSLGVHGSAASMDNNALIPSGMHVVDESSSERAGTSAGVSLSAGSPQGSGTPRQPRGAEQHGSAASQQQGSGASQQQGSAASQQHASVASQQHGSAASQQQGSGALEPRQGSATSDAHASAALQHAGSGTPLQLHTGSMPGGMFHIMEEEAGGRAGGPLQSSGEHVEESDSRSGLNDLAQTWLIQEYCDGGTLADAVRAGRTRNTDGKPNMAKVLHRLQDVAAGMRYLHARNVIHRDLKACNVLLVSDPTAPFGMRAKVADFGLSCAWRQGQSQFSTRTLGTVSHMAPELLRAGKQSPAADVYAFGIVMWELVVGRSAFGNAHYGEVFERVAIAGERPAMDAALEAAVGEEYLLLMRTCWAADPAMRPTFVQVCEALELMLAKYESKTDAPAADVMAHMSAALAVSRPANAASPEPGGVGVHGTGARAGTTRVFDGEWDL